MFVMLTILALVAGVLGLFWLLDLSLKERVRWINRREETERAVREVAAMIRQAIVNNRLPAALSAVEGEVVTKLVVESVTYKDGHVEWHVRYGKFSRVVYSGAQPIEYDRIKSAVIQLRQVWQSHHDGLTAVDRKTYKVQ